MYYAVKVGRETGIFYTWAECEKQVKGYSGSRFKKFKTKQEACQYLGIEEKNDVKTEKKVNSDSNELFVYGVKNGRRIGVFTTWEDCKRQTEGYSHAEYKKFKTLSSDASDIIKEAYEYVGIEPINENIKVKQKKCSACNKSFIGTQNEKTCKDCSKIHFCLICEKPLKPNIELCQSCKEKRKKRKLSTNQMIAIKHLHPKEDIFEYVKNNPFVVNEINKNFTKDELNNLSLEEDKRLKSSNYKKIKYKKEEKYKDFPNYIKNIFEDDETKELLYIEGSKLNPKVYYLCKRCGKEQCQEYKNLREKRGHDCLSSKSSGEVAVKEYLNKIGITYKEQRETLMCENPKTQKQLPYDFELPKYKIIIEVQGNQHNEFVPYFHGTEENFEYQQWKDEFKKEFAEKNGYEVLYIDYNEIKNGNYKIKINSLLKKIKAL